MAIEVVDVDDLVTADEFNQFLAHQVFGGEVKLAPDEWELHAKPARQYALDQILEVLNQRVPSISYSDLAYPASELRLTILAGAAEHLYQLAMMTASLDDNFNKQREIWMEKFQGRISMLAPTLTSGVTAPQSGFTINRA